MPNVKFGRLAPHPEETHPRLHLGTYLTTSLPAPPTSVDWYSEITDWPMYGNADWGDCVEAEIGHHEEVFTGYGQGHAVEVTDDDVLAVYSAVTGFDPNAGPPGNNPTDQGTNIQDALAYWVKSGIAGHKVAAFASVDFTNLTQVRTALALLGPLSVGVNFPSSAMDQFNAGQPWDVVADDGGIVGGHCICLVGYDADFYYVVTWGKVQKLTEAWWKAYVEEAWVPVSTEWVNSAGKDPEGVDLATLGEEFAEITKSADPFPTPTPQPPAPPSPAPTPTPAPESLLQELAAKVRAVASEVESDVEHGLHKVVTWMNNHSL